MAWLWVDIRACSITTLIDISIYDALIIQKQREIVRLVAEDSDNNSNSNGRLIRQRQRELDDLVYGKNNQVKSGASSSSSRSIKEFRRFLLSQYNFA